MRLLHRFGYYLGGFAIGLVLLAFFFSGKKTSCAYFPQARVMKKLRSKPYTIDSEVERSLQNMDLDTVTINRILALGDVDFDKSETRKEPCGLYFIEGSSESGKELLMELENCEDSVVIKKITPVE